MFREIGAGRVALGAVSIGVYFRLMRPWQLRWGATDEEVARPLPGDGDVPHPTFNATRGLTIAARREQIWPWLLQMGVTRAGWYSYDMLDNLGRPSAERIMREFQHLTVGDVIPMSPNGKEGLLVKAIVPNRWMLWGSKAGDSTWYWGLDPIDERHTRLITRVRMRYTWTSPMLLFALLVEFTDIIMMRKCMLGIQRRAEREDSEERAAREREVGYDPPLVRKGTLSSNHPGAREITTPIRHSVAGTAYGVVLRRSQPAKTREFGATGAVRPGSGRRVLTGGPKSMIGVTLWPLSFRVGASPGAPDGRYPRTRTLRPPPNSKRLRTAYCVRNA